MIWSSEVGHSLICVSQLVPVVKDIRRLLVSYLLFADEDMGIYPHAAPWYMYYAWPKAKHGITALSVDKFPYPHRQTGGNKFIQCLNIQNRFEVLKSCSKWNQSAMHSASHSVKFRKSDVHWLLLWRQTATHYYCDVRDDAMYWHDKMMYSFWAQDRHKTMQSKHLIQTTCSSIMEKISYQGIWKNFSASAQSLKPKMFFFIHSFI